MIRFLINRYHSRMVTRYDALADSHNCNATRAHLRAAARRHASRIR